MRTGHIAEARFFMGGGIFQCFLPKFPILREIWTIFNPGTITRFLGFTTQPNNMMENDVITQESLHKLMDI